MACMTVRERFHAAFAGREVDHLPIVEWAPFWDQTVQRWWGEGMYRHCHDAAGTRNDLIRMRDHLGLDQWIMMGTAVVHGCPWRPPHHGAGLVDVAGGYDAVEPHVGTWPVERAAWEWLFSRQRTGSCAAWLVLPGFFWSPREILGIERHLYALADDPGLIHRINARVAAWMLRFLDELDGLGRPDFVTFAEDLSYNHGPMLSRRAFDAYLAPYYRQVVPALKERGIRVIADSDGNLMDCAAWFLDAGIEGLWPLERQAGNDIAALQARHPQAAFIGHYDKMVMPHGGAAMRAEWERLLPAMRRGRFLPSVDHQTPPGVSYAQYLEYLALFREYAGRR